MIHIHLTHNKGYKWFSKDNEIWVKGYLSSTDNQILNEEKLLDYFAEITSFDEFQKRISQANGLFSVVIRRNQSVWVSIDHTWAFPLFYYNKQDLFMITDNPKEFQRISIPLVLNEANAFSLTYSGFVIGNKTLLNDIFQLQPGESLCFENSILTAKSHTNYLTEILSDKNREELKAELKSLLEAVGKRMIQVLNNRPVAIPLSGGFDSRLIAYLLKKNNYPNVICYTFGMSHTIERNNAKRTAERLGYKFHFVDYEKYSNQPLSHDKIFKKYVNFSSNYCCTFAEQDYYAMQELTANSLIPKNTVFIPGHSGAVAGDLLSKKMMADDFPFLDYIMEHIFSYVYPRKKERKAIRENIDLSTDQQGKYPPYMIYEDWRFHETTPKFGYNASKIWDFFGYEYLLPLADKTLFDFFIHLPFVHKYDKNLYKETLSELFKEYDILFDNEELYPSEQLVKKVAFRSKLKKHFPFLKRFVNIEKNDHSGARYYSRSFVEELKAAGNYRKMLSSNGIFSEWYLLQVKNELKSLSDETTN